MALAVIVPIHKLLICGENRHLVIFLCTKVVPVIVDYLICALNWCKSVLYNELKRVSA